ncbi:LLM class F420-dependent oxidoreductase [Enemella dayhoffiae]|uniref:LLM class F420-dependent oxidoreductase n=1 Tax=Enemella dayhoffiae TaxID=2016507 RepID=A0A255GLU9_9ACTN|nr:LLM class flavin-dependent oxidoreductase [Enemella dayhoffiae]OYO16541.1 LLM class F420-dependent oxidoreductase [Enemella dayhoffiae]
MEVCVTLPPRLELAEVPAYARWLESLGVPILHVAETIHDSFLVALLALQATTRSIVRTSMTVAFPRSPMVVAYAARDLLALAPGRFQLGLASQVRGNVVDRFSAAWDRPVPQLEDYLAAVRAAFAAFAGAPLQHHGTHYRLTRMQPYFRPDPVETPPLWTGAVGARMCRLAGRAADGLVVHPTASHPLLLRQRVWPAVRRGAEERTVPGTRPRIIANPFLVTGSGDLHDRAEEVRRELGFLLSTPAYRGVLDVLDEGERADQLAAAAADRDWDRVHGLLDRELLARIVPIAPLEELPGLLGEGYGRLVDGLIMPPPEPSDEARFSTLMDNLGALDLSPGDDPGQPLG